MMTANLRLWTVEEYHRMIEAGIFSKNDKVELLDGQIIQMSPQRPPHSATTQVAFDYIKTKLQGKAYVRMQLPITLSTSEPEPDIAVVQFEPRFYGERHPVAKEIFLLIEVSYTTLDIDRQDKALIYARANIPEYWILDVIERQVYIFRVPTLAGYQSEVRLNEQDSIRLLAFPNIEISFSELFLPRKI